MPAWLLPAAFGLYGAYQGAKQQGKANDLNDQALQMAMQRWNEGQPMRAMALDRLTNAPSQRPDLNSTFVDPSNPFATSLTPAPPPAPRQAPMNPADLRPVGNGLSRKGLLAGAHHVTDPANRRQPESLVDFARRVTGGGR